MSSRGEILNRIRAAGREARPLPHVPLFDTLQPLTPARFQAALELMGGRWKEPPAAPEQLEPFIRSLFQEGATFCSAVPEVASDYDLATLAKPADLASVDVGVVRARFGVVETGSLWLSEVEYGVNALGYLPQHLVALLDPGALVSNLHQVYNRSDFSSVNYCVLMSGPSATADIQGVLIRGAQGVRSLTVIPCKSR